MRQQFLDLLACPTCGATLRSVGEPDRAALACTRCTASYPVRGGMPGLLREAGDSRDATSVAFAQQWQLQDAGRFEQETIYGETAEQELASFRARFGIASPADLDGKRILDVGCGSGRLTRNLARWAPGALVVGGERSDAAWIAHRRCSDTPNALVAQLDLFHPPFQPESFDYVYADGVLPHVPDPEAALRSLDRLVRPGGRIFVWIYPRRFSPYRAVRDVLVRPYQLPGSVQRAVGWAVGVPLWMAFKLYEPLSGPRRRSLHEVRFMIHDNLAPEFQHRRRSGEIEAAFHRLGYVAVKSSAPPTGVVATKPARAIA
jgi:SAM-dependent methyltransferase/uncharacterized protein YbaR (Trm112 family)